MSNIMQHHGCRSHIRDNNKLTGLEDKFDLLVDSNDVILEKVVCSLCSLLLVLCFVSSAFQMGQYPTTTSWFGFQGILLDEADGVNRSQKPVMPVGYQPPKIVVSSWNRKVGFFQSPLIQTHKAGTLF
jgi:exosome complex exonuclease RRP6